MAGLQIRIVADVAKATQGLARKGKALDKAIGQATRDASLIILGNIRKRLAKSKIIGLGDNQPSAWRDLGKQTSDGARWTAAIGSSHPMATFRDTGGTVLPGKSAARGGPRAGQPTRALTIPIGAGITRGGVSRGGRVATGGGISQFGPLKARLFPPRTTSKGSVIMGVLIAGGSGPAKTTQRRGDAIALLARKVVVPPHPYIQPAIDDSSKGIENVFAVRIDKALHAE